MNVSVERPAAAGVVAIGVSNSRRNAAAAVCTEAGLLGVCEQERLTRVRGQSLAPGALPNEAIDCVLHIARRQRSQVTRYAATEADVRLPGDRAAHRLDHHLGHATTAFWSSPSEAALVLVCDRHAPHELTAWRADAAGIEPAEYEWRGPGFATIYSTLTEAFGFRPEDEEHRLEALARLGSATDVVDASALVRLEEAQLVVHEQPKALVAEWLGATPSPQRRADVAATLQRRLGALLQDVVRQLERRHGGDDLCLGGGLFFNSYFTTAIAESGTFARTYVAVNPGNAGVAAGAAIASARPVKSRAGAVSPFLGPAFSPAEVKATLDNCKVSYEYLHEGALVDRVVTGLKRGQLIGWFQGPMEWGSRALGNRSILANPVAPHVLENLNVFLKHRESHRPYSLSACTEDLARYFTGPAESRFMEYEYAVNDPELFRHMMPAQSMRLRVQSVGGEAALFRMVLKAFGAASGTPVLVNTSFNGFHEPIVCSPRDALRVFYGTGLDAAVIGSFYLAK